MFKVTLSIGVHSPPSLPPLPGVGVAVGGFPPLVGVGLGLPPTTGVGVTVGVDTSAIGVFSEWPAVDRALQAPSGACR